METSDYPFLNDDLDLEERINDLLGRLTIKEKYMILTSHGRRRIYSTKPIDRLGIRSLQTPDGPLGVAYHSTRKKCTRFPTTKALAATWNKSLVYSVGEAIGEEVRAIDKHMLLAPGINIDRTPMNGRTFEYFSEDPFLTKELAIQFVKGVQSQRVGACIKHFVANNQETDRRSSSSELDERTLHEIYLRAFRAVVREANPLAIMTCYNMVNGVYGSENEYLIREILYDRWGFEGMVMTDWFASRSIKTTEGCVNAGLTLEMPFPMRYKIKALEESHAEGKFGDETIDELVRRNLRVFLKSGVVGDTSSFPKGSRNTPQHQELARKAAEEGMVLLKNERNLLPLEIDSLETIFLTGPNLKKKFGKLLYGGSSAVVPPYEITPLRGMEEHCNGKVKIVKDASQADAAIVFAGLNHGRGMDSESGDKKRLGLPDKQITLINEVASDNPNTIVVLISGSPISMDEWLENVPVVLEAWYPGMEGGRAIANALFGDVNPSGKLPITFPRKLSDSPAHHSGLPRNYPGDEEKRVFYDEGIFVGYRWFDKEEIEPLFPFGFGLSYTDFELSNIRTGRQILVGPNDSLDVQVDVTNIGDSDGAEVVQIYSQDQEASVQRPLRELVGFGKVDVKAGQTKTLSVRINSEDLAFYDVSTHSWTIEPGRFNLLAGQSSRKILDKIEIDYQS